MIDFVVMLIGYAVSGEPTIQAFSERLSPFAGAFMALFGRADMPHPATLSRFLAALDQATVEALRTLFEEDLVARSPFGSPPGVPTFLPPKIPAKDRLRRFWLLSSPLRLEQMGVLSHPRRFY